MPCAEISETWTLRAPERGEDPFAWPGKASFVLLQGGAPSEWVIFGEDPLVGLDDWDLPPLRFRRSGEVPELLPDFLGFACYEAGYALDPVLPEAPAMPWDFPRISFALHRRVRLWHRPTGRIFEGRREGLPSLGLSHGLEAGPFRARKLWDSDDPEAYIAKVRRIRAEIARGNVYQVDLTRQEAWAYEGSLLDFARRLYELNPAPFSGMLAGEGWAVVSSSPERFLRIQEGRAESRPIKGTVRRGRDEAEDAALVRQLLESAKDRAELAMIVDLVRNDLARVCVLPSVAVEGFPSLESYANVHHLVATVSGRLREGISLRELMRGLFPVGSITGCPKLAAMALLRQLEPCPRLAYTGALGWFRHDLGQLDLAVAIRTCSASAGELRFGVGGGVVWDSNPEAEYEETVVKGRSLVQCLSS